MSIVMFILAMVFIIAAICTGTCFIRVGGEWKTVGITYGLLIIGCVLFGIALTTN